MKNDIWGSKYNIFREWEPGDYIVFDVNRALAGLAVVNGKPYTSYEPVWTDNIYPYRIPIKFIIALVPQNRPKLSEKKLRTAIISIFGEKYGWHIFKQKPITDKNTIDIILEILKAHRNDLSIARKELGIE